MGVMTLVAYGGYIFLASYLAHQRRLHIQSVFDLEYGFGPLVAALVNTGQYMAPDQIFTAHRMPMIPLVLAMLAKLTTDAFGIYLLKNALFGLALVGAFALLWRHTPQVPRWLLLISGGFVLSFPQIVQYMALPDVEEGYLIPFIALLSVALLYAEELALGANGRLLALLAVVNALLYLTKSSMLALSVVYTLLFFCKSRATHTQPYKVLGFFSLALLVAMAGWGMWNYQQSGRFHVMSSWDGLNLYKGNNPATPALYPPYNLDTIDLTPVQQESADPTDEWVIDQTARTAAWAFIRSQPRQAVMLGLERAFILCCEVRRTPIWAGEQRIAGLIQLVGVGYMISFRLLFWLALGLAIRTLWLPIQPLRPLTWQPRVAALTFVGVVAGYSAPYLVGFAYERHVLPLVLPTFFYLLWWLNYEDFDSWWRRHVGTLRGATLAS